MNRRWCDNFNGNLLKVNKVYISPFSYRFLLSWYSSKSIFPVSCREAALWSTSLWNLFHYRRRTAKFNSPSLCSPHNMSRKIFSKDCKTDFFTLLIEALLLWTGWRYNDTGDTAQLLEGQVLQCHVCNCIAIEPCIEMIGRSSRWVQICRD